MSFNVEELGFRRGDALPQSQLTPPPLFPVVATRPAPFEETEELKYLQVLKEDFRTTMTKSPHFLKADEVKNFIERYSDRFKASNDDAAGDDEEAQQLWHMPDRFFPAELTAAPKRKKGKKGERKSKKLKGDAKDIHSKLDELEKKEGDGEEEEEEDEDEENAAAAAKKKSKKKPEKGKEEEDGEEAEEDEEEEEGEGDDDEEENEEMGGNDYEQNYFDNGEDEANTSDDNLDEGGTY